MHVNEKSAKNVLWKSANLLTEHCALHQFLDRSDLNKTNPTSQKWEKNYIDIFISCGEIHLYAFFFTYFRKKKLFDTKFLQEKLIIAFIITRADKKRTCLA